ncbi:uncharacterized protein B0J16DRAFT_345403, partial [Fusarium flagelliforme]|uniref:uncharacterized protein n=1 Tax=Fusarium flagelliforme TaxID=2675880 RepID=UPI001E8E4819
MRFWCILTSVVVFVLIDVGDNCCRLIFHRFQFASVWQCLDGTTRVQFRKLICYIYDIQRLCQTNSGIISFNKVLQMPEWIVVED